MSALTRRCRYRSAPSRSVSSVQARQLRPSMGAKADSTLGSHLAKTATAWRNTVSSGTTKLEFIALGTMWFDTPPALGRARLTTLPNHIVPCDGAQVALQRSPILRTGTYYYSQKTTIRYVRSFVYNWRLPGLSRAHSTARELGKITHEAI